MDSTHEVRQPLTLALTPAAFYILLSLSDTELHGYGIMQEVATITEQTVRLNTGTLYRSLKQLLGTGLIAETATPPDTVHEDERRRYYRLTEAGRQSMQEEARRLQRLMHLVQVKHILPAQ